MTASAPARPSLRKGGEGAAEASKQAPFSRGDRVGMLSLKDAESTILRYITDFDDWIYTAEHVAVPTKAAPLGDDKKPLPNWPKAMTAVCRYDEIFKEIDFYKDCYVCDAKVQSSYGKPIGNAVRIWALAVLREEVFGDGSEEQGGEKMKGKRIGTTDKMVEVETVDKDGKPTGEKVMHREYVIVNFAHKNYFSGLAACYSEYETLCDRDYKVKRIGAGTDSIYTHFALDPTVNLKPGTEKWQTKYIDDLKERGVDLEDIVMEKASDEFYAKFFDPSKTWDPKGGVKDSSAAAGDGDDSTEPDADEQAKMDALRARVQGKTASAAEID